VTERWDRDAMYVNASSTPRSFLGGRWYITYLCSGIIRVV
jgi:hypothetical protein